jgi:hypothetical protein
VKKISEKSRGNCLLNYTSWDLIYPRSVPVSCYTIQSLFLDIHNTYGIIKVFVSGNASDLYSGGVLFESWPGHRLS